jgi:tetratricopeptide (TPR) repeat protein
MNQLTGLSDFEALSDFDNPEETERKYQNLLAAHPEASASTHSTRIELLTQLARVQGLQGKLPEAAKSLEAAQALLNDANETYHAAAKIRFLLESGRLFILNRTPSQARPMFFEAWTLASNSGEDYHAIDAAQMLAAVDPQKLQKEWTLKALSLSDTSPHPKAKQWQGAIFATLGWLQFDVRQFEGALEYFKKSLSSLRASGAQGKRLIVGKWAVARTLRALGRLEEALDMQKDLLAELSSANRKDGLVYEELAECLQSLQKTNEAQVYFDLAYNELSKDAWLSDNKPDRLKRMKTLGKVKNH